ncbi:MAG: G1 family glutamic endopeptidase, partial [Ktedonobacterales bacterium]
MAVTCFWHETHECDHTDPVKDGKPVVNGKSYYNSDIWGGYGSNCSCDHYSAAEGQFTVQNITYSYDTSDSVWVGIGGSACQCNALVQAGVAQVSSSYNNSFHAFYETVAANGYDANEHDLFRVDTGDQMYFYVNDAGHDHLYDYTKSVYDTVDWGYSSTESAEWIVERNCGCPLAHFNPITWRYAQFEDFNNNWGRIDFFGYAHWQLASDFF